MENYRRLLNMPASVVYRKYIWHHDKSEWLSLVIAGLLKRLRPFVFMTIVFSLILTTLGNDESTIASSSDRYFVQRAIFNINKSLPSVEAEFAKIENLANSVTKVAYTDPDRAFIYAFMICKWSKNYNLDPIEVAAIAMTESEFNYKAVSKKDAKGLMQIHKPTWPMKDYFDAEENVKKGAMILHMYKRLYPNNYLSRYSGGEIGYKDKVKRNENKLRKNV